MVVFSINSQRLSRWVKEEFYKRMASLPYFLPWALFLIQMPSSGVCGASLSCSPHIPKNSRVFISWIAQTNSWLSDILFIESDIKEIVSSNFSAGLWNLYQVISAINSLKMSGAKLALIDFKTIRFPSIERDMGSIFFLLLSFIFFIYILF
jgi:hypothetical protein